MSISKSFTCRLSRFTLSLAIAAHRDACPVVENLRKGLSSLTEAAVAR